MSRAPATPTRGRGLYAEGTPEASGGGLSRAEALKAFQEDPEIAGLRLWWGLCYANAMGVCGIVLVALGSTLSALAADAGTTATKAGTVFLARGVGAVTGTVASARLFRVGRRGNSILAAILLALMVVLACLPAIDALWTMHAAWFALGLCTSTLDTGCQIMTRRVHGTLAGPWLGANTVAFAVSGALVPLLQVATGDLFWQYGVLAGVALLNAVAFLFLPHPEDDHLARRLPPRVSLLKETTQPRYYGVEVLTGGAVFWLIGGKVDMTSYVGSYVETTRVIPVGDIPWLLVCMWALIIVGRILGLADQVALKAAASSVVLRHLVAWMATSVAGAAVCVALPRSATALWVGCALYSFGNGPTVGYLYDYLNRTTDATEEGMCVVMFGLNVGASVVPYLTTIVWDRTASGPITLLWVTLLAASAPIFLVAAAAALAGRRESLLAVTKAEALALL